MNVFIKAHFFLSSRLETPTQWSYMLLSSLRAEQWFTMSQSHSLKHSPTRCFGTGGKPEEKQPTHDGSGSPPGDESWIVFKITIIHLTRGWFDAHFPCSVVHVYVLHCKCSNVLQLQNNWSRNELLQTLQHIISMSKLIQMGKEHLWKRLLLLLFMSIKCVLKLMFWASSSLLKFWGVLMCQNMKTLDGNSNFQLFLFIFKNESVGNRGLTNQVIVTVVCK